MSCPDALRSIGARFETYAALETRGRSPLYEELAHRVAGDTEVLRRLASLPVGKQQPNLVLGSIRYLYGAPDGYEAFRTLILDHWDDVRGVILARRTQTNEVARCATLVPLLARLRQPLALLEVGASAGLCLLLDRYRYVYGARSVGPAGSSVVLHCDARGPTPLPAALPEIAWRAGIDLNPLDVRDPAATRWLEALVWPGEGDRLSRLQAAVEMARRDPPDVTRADLTTDLAAVADGAPRDATLVVFHSAALAYVAPEGRARFVEAVRGLGATWVANESLGTFPSIEARLDPEESDRHRGDFVLSCDGEPVAWTDHHGAWVEWR